LDLIFLLIFSSLVLLPTACLGTPSRKFLSRAYETAFSPLDSLNCLLFLDPPAFALGEVIVVATQDWLDVLLKIFAELANFFFYVFSCFSLRHSVFTYLSRKVL